METYRRERHGIPLPPLRPSPWLPLIPWKQRIERKGIEMKGNGERSNRSKKRKKQGAKKDEEEEEEKEEEERRRKNFPIFFSTNQDLATLALLFLLSLLFFFLSGEDLDKNLQEYNIFPKSPTLDRGCW